MPRIDLHTHTTASDGSDSPAQLVRAAAEAGLDVVAVTDHDTVAGHEAAAAALPDGLTLVPGAEISCHWRGCSVHLLAYLFDAGDAAFAAERDRIAHDRRRRAETMVSRLRDLGVDVTWARVAELAAGGAIGRPHIAAAMVELGVVADLDAAFSDRWIGHGGRAYVARYALDPVRAVGLVRAAGGAAVLAHPKAAARGYTLPDELVGHLADAGLTGVEVDHPGHTLQARGQLRSLARELGLVATGSSDYHGSVKDVVLGANTTDTDAYEALLQAAGGGAPLDGRGAGR